MNNLPQSSLGASSPGVAAGDKCFGSKEAAEDDMAAVQCVHRVFLAVDHAEALDWMRMMKHIHLTSKIGSQNSLVDSQADNLVSRMIAENRIGSCRTGNATLCILVCCVYQTRYRHTFRAFHVPHTLQLTQRCNGCSGQVNSPGSDLRLLGTVACAAARWISISM
jgi:hypothetical protein